MDILLYMESEIVSALCIILFADNETAVNIDRSCIIKISCQLRTRSETEKMEKAG
jgi:hypothetical protein